MTSTMKMMDKTDDAGGSALAVMMSSSSNGTGPEEISLFDGDLCDGELNEFMFPLFVEQDDNALPSLDSSSNNNSNAKEMNNNVPVPSSHQSGAPFLVIQEEATVEQYHDWLMLHPIPYLPVMSSPVHESQVLLDPVPVTPPSQEFRKTVLVPLAPKQRDSPTWSSGDFVVTKVPKRTASSSGDQPHHPAKRTKTSANLKKTTAARPANQEEPVVAADAAAAPNPLTTAANACHGRNGLPVHSWPCVVEAAVHSLNHHLQPRISSSSSSTTSSSISSKDETTPTAEGDTVASSSNHHHHRNYDQGDDLSTDRILALAGEDGGAEFMKAVSIHAHTTPSFTGSSGRPVTAEERAEHSRNRNREHARNTRLRKKAYVDELKRVLNQLVVQRDQLQQAEASKAQIEADQRSVRMQVIQELFNLRGRNEGKEMRWQVILEPEFEWHVPRMEETGMDSSSSSLQVLSGHAQVMQESNRFATVVSQALAGCGGSSNLQYQCDRDTFLMDGCQVFVRWTAAAPQEPSSATGLCFGGSFRARFNPESNKLVSAHMMYDTGAVLAQLKTRLYKQK